MECTFSRGHHSLFKFDNPEVKAVYDAYPASQRKALLHLRELVLKTAYEMTGAGEIEESLKWGQPTFSCKTGSPIRVGVIKNSETEVAMYFICTTTLIQSFRERYPSSFHFEGNRALIFDVKDELPMEALKHCIAMALTYKL